MDNITEIFERGLRARDKRDKRETIKVLHYLLDNELIYDDGCIADRENVNTTEDIATELYNEYLKRGL